MRAFGLRIYPDAIDVLGERDQIIEMIACLDPSTKGQLLAWNIEGMFAPADVVLKRIRTLKASKAKDASGAR